MLEFAPTQVLCSSQNTFTLALHLDRLYHPATSCDRRKIAGCIGSRRGVAMCDVGVIVQPGSSIASLSYTPKHTG